jgi:cytoskeletal protein CcmA (bactofilin family)
MFSKKDKVVSKNGNAPSILSANLRVVGNLTTDGELQVDGTVEGDVTAGRLTVGASARITGNANAEQVIVQGEVRGAIHARTVQLGRSAKVTGDIGWRETLTIEAGAYYEGQCKHSDKSQDLSEHAALPETGSSFLQRVM